MEQRGRGDGWKRKARIPIYASASHSTSDDDVTPKRTAHAPHCSRIRSQYYDRSRWEKKKKRLAMRRNKKNTILCVCVSVLLARTMCGWCPWTLKSATTTTTTTTATLRLRYHARSCDGGGGGEIGSKTFRARRPSCCCTAPVVYYARPIRRRSPSMTARRFFFLRCIRMHATIVMYNIVAVQDATVYITLLLSSYTPIINGERTDILSSLLCLF